MKRVIKITDKVTGKVTVGEHEVRNMLHFDVQRNTRANVFRARKGRGSYCRKQKYGLCY